MPCPTCDHTLDSVMQQEGSRWFHCGRCGTMVHENAVGYRDVSIPKLVARCRDFGNKLHIFGPISLRDDWRSLGIAESIQLPGEF